VCSATSRNTNCRLNSKILQRNAKQKSDITPTPYIVRAYNVPLLASPNQGQTISTRRPPSLHKTGASTPKDRHRLAWHIGVGPTYFLLHFIAMLMQYANATIIIMAVYWYFHCHFQRISP